MELQKTPNQLSRRNWLRDAAIAATGAAVLPSLLTSCSDHRIPPGVGIGDPENIPLTDFELYSAAQNLLNMEAWLSDFYTYSIGYELEAYALIKSGTTAPADFKDFIVDLFINIGAGLLEAAATEIPFVGPVVAITIETTKSWLVKANRPPALVDASFADFVGGHNRMQKALSDTLLTLADRTDNYRNLRERWTGHIPFNGKEYTLKDLASAQFPIKGVGTEFVALRDAAYTKFKKDFWNVMLIKAGSMTYSSYWSIPVFSKTPSLYGRDIHYKDYPATYLRGWYEHVGLRYYFRYWYFTVDGRELSAEAAHVLFKDDSPENIINPEGLFYRSYVFKQFRREKLDFFGYHELRKDSSTFPSYDNELDFDLSAEDNYNFTGGDFPELIKK